MDVYHAPDILGFNECGEPSDRTTFYLLSTLPEFEGV
jgi:hypothetical protein